MQLPNLRTAQEVFISKSKLSGLDVICSFICLNTLWIKLCALIYKIMIIILFIYYYIIVQLIINKIQCTNRFVLAFSQPKSSIYCL